MKKIRKIGAFTLALVMCFALASTAFAENAEGPFNVTITNKDATADNYEDFVYTAYQLFSGVLDEEQEEGHTVTYLSDIQWGSMFGSTQDIADQAGAAFLEELQEAKTVVGVDSETSADITLGSCFKNCTSAAGVAAVLAEKNNNTTLVEAFADFVAQYIESDAFTANAAGPSAASENTGGEGYVYTISDLNPGYYIILNTSVPTDENEKPYESAWTDPILQVVENVEIEAKSDLPTVKKEIVDNDQTDIESGLDSAYSGTEMTYTDNTENEAIGQVGDYSIGTDIWFQLTGTLPSNYGSYDTYEMIFHDTESAGLTFDSESVTVYVDVNGNGENLVKVSSESYTVSTSNDDKCTFEVQITDTKSLKDATGREIATDSSSKIVVQYKSTLNSSAVIGNNGNPNEVYMEFSNKSYNNGTGKTQPYKVWAFTFELDVSKTNEEGVPLDGAQFVLRDGEGDGAAYLAIYGEDGNLIKNSTMIQEGAKYTLKWISADEAFLETDTEKQTTQNVTIFESDNNGNFSIVGLDEGTYYLEEIKAPDGYNMLDGAIKLEIEATYKIDETTGDVTCSNLTISVDNEAKQNGSKANGTVSATVINKHGSTLPSTGGIGTTIFYVVGGVLVVGALVLLVSKRRMAKQGQ